MWVAASSIVSWHNPPRNQPRSPLHKPVLRITRLRSLQAVLSAFLVAFAVAGVTANRAVAQSASDLSLAPDAFTSADDEADLSISIGLDKSTVQLRGTVVIVVTLRNDGPNTATGVRVDAKTKELDTSDAQSTVGDVDVNGRNIKWEGITIGPGQSLTLTITALVTDLPAIFAVEVKKSDILDPDSRPGKGTAEDDNGTVVFSKDGSSSGSTGGLESNGSLSTTLAQLLYSRRQVALARAESGEQLPVVVFRKDEAIRQAKIHRAMSQDWLSSHTAKSGHEPSHDLRSFIPELGPQGIPANEVSPADLLPVTNAIDLFAVDYVRDDGRRVGTVFAASTEGDDVYEHTKVVCDRLRGATLEAIELIDVRDHEFVVSQLVQADSTVDYAVSFVVYDHGASFEVDSRFVLGDYSPPATAAPTYNYQVWSETRDDMISIASQMLDALEAVAPVAFATDETAVVVPDVYVRTGHYQEGELVLEVVNRAGATQLFLDSGTLALTEGGERQPFVRASSLPALGEDDPYESVVRIDLGPMFDADFSVSADSSVAPDLLYLADGSWSWAVDPGGTVENFSVRPADVSRFGDSGTFVIERGGSLSGEISRWATLFRYLRPNGTAVDLSEYSYLEFVASGQGTLRVQVEKESLAGSNQFGRTFVLTEEPRTYRVWFDDLITDDGTRGFSAEDLVLISFNAENFASIDGQPTPGVRFKMDIDQVRFRGGTADVASVRPDGPVLYQSYPNPVEGVAEIRFDLPEPGLVRLGVFDVLGRKVAALADGWHPAGPHTLTFDTAGLATGMYFTWLESELGFKTTSLVVK